LALWRAAAGALVFENTVAPLLVFTARPSQRQGYGRVKVAVLRKRVLRAA
jgi:hypothetical protein